MSVDEVLKCEESEIGSELVINAILPLSEGFKRHLLLYKTGADDQQLLRSARRV